MQDETWMILTPALLAGFAQLNELARPRPHHLTEVK
jgi:hypothetical protein